MPARTVRSTPSTARVWPKTLTRPLVCMARVGWGSNAVDILSLQRSGIRIPRQMKPRKWPAARRRPRLPRAKKRPAHADDFLQEHPRTCHHPYHFPVTQHTGHPRKNYSYLARPRADYRHRTVREHLYPRHPRDRVVGFSHSVVAPTGDTGRGDAKSANGEQAGPATLSVNTGPVDRCRAEREAGVRAFSIDYSRTTDVTDPSTQVRGATWDNSPTRSRTIFPCTSDRLPAIVEARLLTGKHKGGRK